MYTPARVLTIIFSLCLHGSLVGFLTFFSAEAVPVRERVYQVSLAEFTPAPAAGPVTEAVPEKAAPPAPTEPPPPVKPEPVVKPIPPKHVEPEKKTISPKKRAEAPKPKEQPKQQPVPQPVATPSQASSEPAAPSGGGSASGSRARQIGGLLAHDVDAVDQRPSIARTVIPEYPTKARRMNVEGNAVVRIVVDISGQPRACEVEDANPPGYFEEAALKAAQKTRFIPGKIKGQPVNTVVLIPFRFALR